MMKPWCKMFRRTSKVGKILSYEQIFFISDNFYTFVSLKSPIFRYVFLLFIKSFIRFGKIFRTRKKKKILRKPIRPCNRNIPRISRKNNDFQATRHLLSLVQLATRKASKNCINRTHHPITRSSVKQCTRLINER